MPQMKVLLADDHPIVLMGVREIIERDPRFKVVGEAMNSSELISKVSQLQLLQPFVTIALAAAFISGPRAFSIMTAAAARPPAGTVVRLLRLAGFPILRQLQLEEALLRCVALGVCTAAHRSFVA